MKETFADRLRYVMALRETRQIDLVEKTGISKSLVNKYVSGKTIPSGNNLTKIANALDINETWLLGYETEIERDKEVKNIVDEYRALLNKDTMLTKSQKDFIMDFIIMRHTRI